PTAIARRLVGDDASLLLAGAGGAAARHAREPRGALLPDGRVVAAGIALLRRCAADRAAAAAAFGAAGRRSRCALWRVGRRRALRPAAASCETDDRTCDDDKRDERLTSRVHVT